MSTATASPSFVLPVVEDSALRKLREARDTARARRDALQAEWPTARALAHTFANDTEHQRRYDTLSRELRTAEGMANDCERTYSTVLDERRRKVGHELAAGREYRAALLAAVTARAERLQAEGLLVGIHTAAIRQAIPVSPALPAAVIADVDGLVKWSRELVRLEMIDAKRLPVWLQSRIEE